MKNKEFWKEFEESWDAMSEEDKAEFYKDFKEWESLDVEYPPYNNACEEDTCDCGPTQEELAEIIQNDILNADKLPEVQKESLGDWLHRLAEEAFEEE